MSTNRELILHVREANIWGSPERLILGQVRFLSKYECLPVTYRRRGQSNAFAEHLRGENLPCVELDEFGPGDLRTISQLKKLIRERKPRLIVTHEFKSNLYGYFAARATGVPHIVHFHGFTAEGLKVRLYNAIDRAVMRRCRSVLTVAEQTKELLATMGVDKQKIEVVINAVAPEAFERVSSESFAPQHGRKLIVAAGRLSYEKGNDLLIRAAKLIKGRGVSFDMRIFGEGPERQALESLIDSLSLGDCVRLEGFAADLRPAYGQAEFLVIPSRSEAFPLVLLEAWAQGTPVVATPVGRLPELIESGVTGYLAQETSVEAIAAVIEKALQIPDFHARCGAAGQELVKRSVLFPGAGDTA